MEVSRHSLTTGPVGDGDDLHAHAAGKLVLGDQTHGQQQGVAVIVLLSAGDGLEVPVHLGDGDAGDALLALDVDHGVAQLQRNAEIIKTLDYVSLKAAGVGHDLRHDLDLGALEGHAAGHDQADVTGA